MACFIGKAPADSQQVADASVQIMYQQSLGSAFSRMQHNWEAATVARRAENMQELDSWLGLLPAAMEKNLATCTPADLLVYMESHWLPNHAGTLLPDGSMIASPSGVSGCVSNLSTGFMLIGRVGDWYHSTSTGNPVVSTDLTQYRKGYKMQAWRSGYLEGSAVPLSSKKVFQLVDHLEHSMQSCPAGQQQLLIERDIMLILLMWETPLRGNDIGKVSFTDFFLHDGQPIQTPTGQLQGLSSTAATGFQLNLRPNGTKTVKCQRSGPFTLTVTEDRQHCFLARLFSFIQHRFPAGQMASTYLFSPLTANRRSFADAPMRATSIGHRLNKHLESAKMYAGESNHGFRRGQIQDLVAVGVSKPQIGEAVQIKTASVLEKYADVSRHIRRLQRLGKRKSCNDQSS